VLIPFFDLHRQYTSIRQDVEKAMAEVFSNGQFIGGLPVKNFEKAFAARIGRKHCIGTGNGTDALFIILKCLGIGPGDEVITPAFGCMPSSEVISLTGATPVFADVDPEYYTLDPESVRQKITSRTRGIMAVHLFGQAAPLHKLRQLCDEYKLHLIEDCAQAHLTAYQDNYAGSFGAAAAFSFYPTKNLGAYGDAGCMLTDDDQLAETLRRFANHGSLIKDDHKMEGTNSRLDTLQAAILHVKLKHLDAWNARRRELANRYYKVLNGIDALVLPKERPETKHSWHIFAIRCRQRDQLHGYLQQAGIGTLIHYPYSLPFTEAYSARHHSCSDFPVAAALPQELLSLPIYPELTDDEVDFIGTAIRQYFNC
jgi:dTDP-4-amino-4,6-dideoxygalactose transaminase